MPPRKILTENGRERLAPHVAQAFQHQRKKEMAMMTNSQR